METQTENVIRIKEIKKQSPTRQTLDSDKKQKKQKQKNINRTVGGENNSLESLGQILDILYKYRLECPNRRPNT